jgi:hypothetical protein
MTCDIYVNCPPSPSYPLIGFNSETQDVQDYVAMGFGPLTPPPLNWNFQEATGYAAYTSLISKADAQANAFANAVANAQSTWSPPGEIPPVESGEPDTFPFDATGMFLSEAAGLSELPIA